MPRIDQSIIDSVFYLYQTAEDAEAGVNPQGTGFIVSYKNFKGGIYNTSYYGITNWHVARRGSSVVRLKRIDGMSAVFEFFPEEWECIAGGPDIAAIPLNLDPRIHRLCSISTDMFISDHQRRSLSVGEDVFMVGLFVNHAGIATNNPQARFGNISMIASDDSKIRQETGFEGQSYIVDTHSRTGFSGSPVFVYRTHLGDFGSSQELRGQAHSDALGTQISRGVLSNNSGRDFDVSIKLPSTLFALLGIHWGQFPERWDILDSKSPIHENQGNSLVSNGGYVKGVSGMTLAIPSSEIMNLLKLPKFAEQRDQEIDKVRHERLMEPMPDSSRTKDSSY